MRILKMGIRPGQRWGARGIVEPADGVEAFHRAGDTRRGAEVLRPLALGRHVERARGVWRKCYNGQERGTQMNFF